MDICGRPPDHQIVEPMGRHKRNYYSYEEARDIVQAEEIASRAQYVQWWDRYQPKMLPKYPADVYEGWTSWNDFLGNDNRFKVSHRKYRSYDECFIYAQESSIKTSMEWMDHNHPPDIPRRPDLHYQKQFTGWKSFLGTGKKQAQHVVDAAKVIQENNVLLIALPPDSDGSIIHLSIQPGVAKCKEFLTSNHMRFIKAFKMEQGYDWRSVVQVHCTDYGNGEWYCTNVHQLLFDINLEWIN